MKLTFLGTRGYLDVSSRRHRRHTSTLVEYRGRRLMIDCGLDWTGRLAGLRPGAILITHPHPDHAFAIRDEAPPCPVYAIPEAWEKMADFAVSRRQRRTLRLRRRIGIAGIGIEPFSVIHSTRAPAVGYRLTAGRVAVFYVPDVIWIHEREAAFRGIRLYVGDGATIDRPMVRKEKGTGRLVGHTTVMRQIGWCASEGVPGMVVTHCGRGIVEGDERQIRARLRRAAGENGVDLEIAHDGMELVLR